MLFEDEISHIRQDLENGRHRAAALQGCGAIEQALRHVVRHRRSGLDEKDRLLVLRAEQEIGKGNVDIEGFAFGALLRLVHQSKFLDACTHKLGLELSAVRTVLNDHLRGIRNAVTHRTRPVTASAAAS